MKKQQTPSKIRVAIIFAITLVFSLLILGLLSFLAGIFILMALALNENVYAVLGLLAVAVAISVFYAYRVAMSYKNKKGNWAESIGNLLQMILFSWLP